MSSESENVAQLQNIVDLLNKEITSDSPRQLIADNTISTHSLERLDKFNTYQENSPHSTYVSNSDQSSGLQNARVALESKLSRMLAAIPANTPANSSP